MASATHEVIYELALRALTSQRERVDNIRGRAATLLSAAAIVTAFLGAEAIKDTKLQGGRLVPDRSLEPAEIVGLAAFVGVGLACLLILWPRSKKWRFEMSAKKLVEHYAPHEIDVVHLNLALWMEKCQRHNEPMLGKLAGGFRAGAFLLLVEVVALVIDLS